MFRSTKERYEGCAISNSPDLPGENFPAGVIESVIQINNSNPSRSRWFTGKIKKIKSIALPLAVGVVGGALGRIAAKELIIRTGLSFGTGFVGAVIGGAVLGATVEAGKQTIEIGREKYKKYQQEVAGNKESEQNNQAYKKQFEDFYREELTKYQPVTGNGRLSHDDCVYIHSLVQDRFKIINDERMVNGGAPLKPVDLFSSSFLGYLTHDNLKGDLKRIGRASVRGLIVGAIGGAAFDLALEFVQHVNWQLPHMEWKMPWDQGLSGGGQVDVGAQVSTQATFTPSPTETVIPTHIPETPVISPVVSTESIIPTAGIHQSLVSGSIVDHTLTYDRQPWDLMDNGVKNIGNLMANEAGIGILDQDALAMQLQEATNLWAKGQLDPNSDLYRLFNLSNGTASIYKDLISKDTLQSLKNLSIVK